MELAPLWAVRIMAEFDSNGIWEVADAPWRSLEYFWISPVLFARLQRWVRRYEELETARLGLDLHDQPGWTDFNREGYDIAFAVKAELPEWRVVFVDEPLFDLGSRAPRPIEIPLRLQ